ncbi:MAG: hypothetical protein M5R40_06920 [Anaerolineae bacterium]|nr:hypothetical protein [Anaerolineae bacterium]
MLTWLSFGVYILLADILVFLRDSVPLLAALHPVMAVVLFAIAVTLARRAWRFAREPEAATTPAIDRDVADVAAEVAGGRRGL